MPEYVIVPLPAAFVLARRAYTLTLYTVKVTGVPVGIVMFWNVAVKVWEVPWAGLGGHRSFLSTTSEVRSRTS
jgi:hypothetical protein